MLYLICDVLPTLSITESTAIFLFKVRRRVLFRIIRSVDATETLIDQIDEHSLRQVAELGHFVEHLSLTVSNHFKASDKLCQ